MSVASQRIISAAARPFQSGWQKLKAGAVRFREENRGSVFPLFAFSIIPLIGASGLAVDATKAFMVKDQLQKSIDAAALAAGNASSEANMQGDAQQFFDANFHFDSTLAAHQTVNVVVDSVEDTIMITAAADVPTSFMTVFGMDKISVSANTLVRRETRGMELVLVMDNTGSMSSGGKLAAMQTAAKDLVDIVYGNEETVEDLYVGVVPYVAYVNVGSGNTSWLAAGDRVIDDPGDFGTTTWKGCVMARAGNRDRNDDPPNSGANLFTSYFWDDDDADHDWRDDSDPDDPVYSIDEGHTYPQGPNSGCPTPIIPLQASKSVVKTAIDAMDWWWSGGTHMNLGLVWGWRVISPNWRGYWGAPTPPELPLDYDNTQMDKVLVLLTDGRNQYFPNGYGVWDPHPDGSHFTAYGRPLAFTGSTNISIAETELNSRTADVCTNMKTEEIIVYTITFGSTPNTTIKNIMKACASDPDNNYFHAPNNATLQTIFRAIGQKLSNLRIEQ